MSVTARGAAWLLAPLMLAAMVLLYGIDRPSYVMGDFRAFFCAGSAIAQHASPYLEEPLRTCEATAGPPAEPVFLRPVAVPAPLPPYALLLFVPFAALPFGAAAVLYGLLSLGAMVLAVALLQRVTGASSVLLNLAFAAITATVTFYVGQPMPFVLAALAGAALLARGGRWTAAALCVAFASIEPHVALAAIVGIMVASARARVTLVLCGLVLAFASVAAVGFPAALGYLRDVIPAHALANAYEWQLSLTSILTSLGVGAPAAIRAGEVMFAAMVALGVAVAARLRARTGDAALMVIVPPAFAVLGGVHVHFQQIAVAFPALLYALVRYPHLRRLAGGGLVFAMIPWNVLGATVLAGAAPLLAGAFGALALGRRAGLIVSLAAAGIVLSLLAFAMLGLGPAEAHFVARTYPPGALAELSWADFSHAALMRPSAMMQWLRIPTLAGLACGLFALVRIAYGEELDRALARLRAPETAGRLLPWTCIGAVVAWLLALAVRFPHGDGDLLWQRWLGERILREHAIPRSLGGETLAAAGAPWTPHEWLFSLALAWTGDHGAAWAVPALCALAVGVALAAVVLRCRRRGVSAPTASVAVLLCALAAIQSFGARGQVLGWACLATVVALLEEETALAWLAVPVTAAWANLHASAFLAPVIAGTFTVAAALRDRAWSAAVRRAAALTAGCAAATLATPFGLDLPRYALALLTSPIRHSISEWGATSIASAAFVAGALPLVLLLAAYGVRASLRDRLVAALFTVLLFTAVRNVPVFAIVAAPIALAALPLRDRRLAAPTPAGVRWATCALVACCGVTLSVLTWRSAPAAGDALPLATSSALLAQARAAPRVFCEDFAWCSIFLGGPARFFMDGRCDPYPPAIWRDYREVIDGNRGWDTILDAYRVDAVLVRRDSALDSLLAERAGTWRPIAADGPSRLYVRPAPVAALR